jgi:hypothetical protein
MLIAEILATKIHIDLHRQGFFLAGAATIQGRNLLVGIVTESPSIVMLK